MSAHLPPTAPGANIPGGDPAGPPVLAYGSPDRPPMGTASPTAYGSGSPLNLNKARVVGIAFLYILLLPRCGELSPKAVGDPVGKRPSV